MQEQLLSIIIPVYKVEDYLERCIGSVINQTYKHLEIILVDDGSPDNCGKICDKYQKNDSRIRVLHIENGGAARARNKGLDIAKGEYIGFVDSDDYIEPDMYEKLIDAMIKTGADISAAGIIRENEKQSMRSVIRMPQKRTLYSDEETLREILRSRYVGSSVWSKVYRRNCWDSVRFPEGEINEDTKIIFELHKGRSLIHTAEPLYHYVIRENSVTASLSLRNLELAINNAGMLVEKSRLFSEELVKDAVYFQTSCARNCLFVMGLNYKDTNLYKECRSIYNRNWQILDGGMKELLLRVNLYHFVRSIVKIVDRK